MSKPGRVFKQCGCRATSGRRLGEKCPRLVDRAHGSWYFDCSAPNMLGRSERARREGLIESNPARHIEVAGYRRPHARVWTDARVAEWRATGQRSAVAVWTAGHLAAFLTAVVDDSLFALWWLIGLRGLRRGEA